MTTYTTIPDADIDQDSPVTQPLMTALRDNPIAIAEGASGAPKLQNAALGGLYLGSINANSGVYSGISDLDDIEEVFLIGRVDFSENGDFRVRFSDDNGSTWSAATTIKSDSLTDYANINLVTGVVSYYEDEIFDPPQIRTETATLPSGNVNAFQLYADGGTSSRRGLGFFAFATKGKS